MKCIGKTFIVWILLLVVCFPAHPQDSNKTILVLKAGEIEPIPTIVKGIRNCLKDTDPKTKITEYLIIGDGEDAVNIVKKINPSIILTIGKDIAKKLAQNTPNTPIVIVDMFRPAYARSFPKDRFVVQSLYVRPQTGIDYIKKIIPRTKTISIIYSQNKNADIVEDADKYAQSCGITIKKFPINSEKDIASISSLDSDALLLVPDTLTCNPISLQKIIAISLQSNVPIMGISEYFAQTGTIMAIAPDFESYSTQIGKSLSLLLNGASTDSIETSFPDKVDYFLNLSIAKLEKIAISQEIITGAKKTFGH